MISVIIPVYNVEQYIRQCLNSIVNQTYKDLEIIIIDDGSPDECGTICDKYAKNDARIKVIHKENGGLCAARNEGIRLASGEWLTFVDSDDWLELTYFENMASLLNLEKVDVLCAGGGYLDYESRQSIRRIFYKQETWNRQSNKEHLIAKVLTGQAGEIEKRKGERPARLCTAWDKICKTTFIKDNSIFFDENDKAYEDIWYSLLVITQAETIVGCDCVGYHYRMIEGSITKGYNPQKTAVAHANLDKTMRLFDSNTNEIIHSAIIAYGFDLFMDSLFCSALHPQNKERYREKISEIKKAKALPCFYEVTHSKDIRFLPLRIQIKRFLFSLPCEWLMIVLYDIKRKVGTVKKCMLKII